MIIYFFRGILLFLVFLSVSCEKPASENLPKSQESVHLLFEPDSTSLLEWVNGLYLQYLKEKGGPFQQKAANWKNQWDSLTHSGEFLNYKKEAHKLKARDKTEFLKSLVYGLAKIQFDSSKLDFQKAFPQEVWAQQKGNCMGTSMLLLALSQELNIPLYGVLLPGHFFLRYQDSISKINLEPNRNGYSYTNEEYIQKYLLHPKSPYKLDNLKPSQLAGVYLYNLGSIYFDKNKMELAKKYLEAALKMYPHYPEALGNLGLVYIALNQWEKAGESLEKAYLLDPYSRDVYHNLSGYYLRTKAWDKAQHLIHKGLGIFPKDPQLLYNLGLIYNKKGIKDSARIYLKESGINL